MVVDAGMHRTASRSMSLGFGGLGATVAGAPAGHGMELSSPPPADALDALVAAAGYAGRHGTPAIQAAMAAAGLAQGPGLGGDAAGGLQALPLPKRKRLGEPGGGGEQLLLEQEKAALLARRQGAAFLEGWQPVAPHVLMLRSIVELLGAHQWSPEEQEDCLRFRWALAAGEGRLGEGGGWAGAAADARRWPAFAPCRPGLITRVPTRPARCCPPRTPGPSLPGWTAAGVRWCMRR